MNGAVREQIRKAIDERQRQLMRDETRRPETHCLTCNHAIEPLDHRGRQSRQRFCTPTCRKRWHDKRRR